MEPSTHGIYLALCHATCSRGGQLTDAVCRSLWDQASTAAGVAAECAEQDDARAHVAELAGSDKKKKKE